MFEQADGGQGGEGNGIGLAVANELAAAMGGRIEIVSSAPGSGSVLRFTVSLALPEAGDAAARPLAAPARNALAGREFLILAPQGPVADLLGRCLADHGAGLRHLSDPAAIARIIAQGSGSGAELIVDSAHAGLLRAALARSPRAAAAAPVWLMLASQERRSLADLLTGALSGYLVKPLRREALIRNLMDRAGFATPAVPPRPTRAGLDVLLAEDNAINAKLTRVMLSHAGHRVSHVSDGAALIAYLERRIADGSRWPDIVLMDMHMPELDGPAATQALRALEARHGRPATPVLALTANARPEDEEACLAAGMNGYLSKPFERGDLEAAILRLTASRRAA